MSSSIFDEKSDDTVKKTGSNFYIYTDQSGRYNLKKERKQQSKKLITRTKLFPLSGNKELESTISVSRIGKIKTSKGKMVTSILPEISQFRVWYEKKEHFSQLKINRKTRQLEVLSKSPDNSYKGKTLFNLPPAKYYCFFSQFEECVKEQNLLVLAARKKVQVFVIWDNFPYHSEQYEGLGPEPFVNAIFALDKHDKKNLKYSLDIGSQVIFYQFDKKLRLSGMYWVTQGISAVSVDKEF